MTLVLSSLQNSDKMLGIADHFITSFCNEFNKFNRNVLKKIHDKVKEDMFDMSNVSKNKVQNKKKTRKNPFVWIFMVAGKFVCFSQFSWVRLLAYVGQ